QKMHWNDTNQLPFRLFWWQSPDGSKVLTYFPTDYVHDNVNPTRISADFAESAQRNPGTAEMLDLYGIGDHGGGPTRAMLDQADHWITSSHSQQNAVISHPQQNSVILSDGRSPESKDPNNTPPSQAPSTLSSTEAAAIPTMRYGTAQQYFSNVEKNLNPDSPTWDYDSIAKGYTPPPASSTGAMGLPTWKDELYFEYHRGVFTTQAAHKRNMRTSEVATLHAEKLASLAWLNGRPYPADQLNENWKKITFNQFHDLAAGSGIGVIYKDAQKDYTELFHVDNEIDETSIGDLAARADTRVKSGVPILVTNTLAWPRSETFEATIQLPEHADSISLKDEQNRVLPITVLHHDVATNTFKVLVRSSNVPSLGYKVLNAIGVNGKQPIAETSIQGQLAWRQRPPDNSIILGNDNLSVEIDKSTGCIKSLKRDNKEFIAPNGCGNQLQTFKDTPKQYDAWNIDPGTLDGTMTPISQVDSIQLIADGQLRESVRITRHWQSSKFVQDISLDANADTIVIANEIDWHETHVLLKAAFPLAATGPKATYEIPYGSIERPTTRNNSWEKAKFEVPAMRWADLGDAKQGLSVLNDSKYGYDAAGNTLRITLLRSATWPDEVADKGHQQFTYALYPHAGTWKQALTVRRGYELNDPLKAEQVFPHTGTLTAEHSWASIENPNVTLTAIKKAEDSDALVFRMYEWAGTATDVKLHIPPGATYAIETTLMEKPQGAHLNLSGDVVTVPIKPYEILTIEATYPHNETPTHSVAAR
ncbi:MAG TPA: glycoside hydrolase family 38 C-terminal domain-containing protein, partial [Edaphobacter sp.]|nr:glycoside hydrolase family 38 C-terminal domain-containing protein [Edaphobacter sp.]